MDADEVSVVIGRSSDKVIFRNLMQLYLYDFSEYTREDPDDHGIFEYNYLDHYWASSAQEEGRVPFLITVNNRIAGFALKAKWSCLGRSDTDNWMAEFFVMRKWRRQGIGRYVAFELFRRFPGVWEVAQLRSNTPAQEFWRSVIDQYTEGHFQTIESFPPGWDGYVQIFRSG